MHTQEESDVRRSVGLEYLAKTLNKLHSKNRKLYPRVDLANSSSKSEHRIRFIYVEQPLRHWNTVVQCVIGSNSEPKISTFYEVEVDTGAAGPLTETSTRTKRIITNKEDLLAVLSAQNQQHLIHHFNIHPRRSDFQTIFCICHTREEETRTFIKCSSGCCVANEWIHPQCVGLGNLSKTQLEELGEVICPFCSLYLHGSGQDSNLNAKLLSKITLGYVEFDRNFRGFHIEESNMPHTNWGLDQSRPSHRSHRGNVEPILEGREVLLSILRDDAAQQELFDIYLPYETQDYGLASELPQPIRQNRLAMVASLGSEMDQISEESSQQFTRGVTSRPVVLSDGRQITVGVSAGCLNQVDGMGKIIEYHNRRRENWLQPPVSVATMNQRAALLDSTFERMTTAAKTNALKDPLSVELTTALARDGQPRISVICAATSPKSWHRYCSLGTHCGLCFEPFVSKSASPHASATTQAANTVHEHCSMWLQKVVEIKGLQSVNGVQVKQAKWDADDNISCVLCGHTGGVLCDIEIDSKPISLSRGSLVAHYPCLEYLRQSKMLEKSTQEKLKGLAHIATRLKGAPLPEDIACAKELIPFDLLMNTSECQLCGGNEGLVVRCCGESCSIRIHPLCAMMSDKFQFVEVELDNAKSVAILCRAHRVAKGSI